MKAVLNITRNVLVIPRIFKSYFARVTLSCYRSSKKKKPFRIQDYFLVLLHCQ